MSLIFILFSLLNVNSNSFENLRLKSVVYNQEYKYYTLYLLNSENIAYRVISFDSIAYDSKKYEHLLDSVIPVLLIHVYSADKFKDSLIQNKHFHDLFMSIRGTLKQDRFRVEGKNPTYSFYYTTTCFKGIEYVPECNDSANVKKLKEMNLNLSEY